MSSESVRKLTTLVLLLPPKMSDQLFLFTLSYAPPEWAVLHRDLLYLPQVLLDPANLRTVATKHTFLAPYKAKPASAKLWLKKGAIPLRVVEARGVPDPQKQSPVGCINMVVNVRGMVSLVSHQDL